MNKVFNICTGFLAALLLLLDTTVSFGQDKRPNIIYVMADDMGYADLSSYGRRDFKTPVIDEFIRSGIKFNNAYAAAPVCTPTRVAFMTGRYPARNLVGLREPLTNSAEDRKLGLSADIPTLSSILKNNGYETALFGKWHLGVTSAAFPLNHGFDHFFGILSGAADYADHKAMDRSGRILIKGSQSLLYENEKPVKKSGYLTDLITDYATQFIRKEHEKPFFISIQYTSPHWPWQAPGSGPTTDTIVYNENGSPDIYAQMVTNLDKNFGRILQALHEEGLEHSTMIIFTSDNGGDRLSNMGPFKGKKLELWEGGIRVPAAARWPQEIGSGLQSDQPVITMDWTVTILDVAKCALPDSLKFDGISLRPHYKNQKYTVSRTFYWRTSNRASADAIRVGDWKYMRNGEGEFLFNLSEDPHENNNLKEERQEKLTELKSRFASMNAEMLEPVVLIR